MDYKLVLVEGLPGTGKTTLSEQIFKLFTKHGIQGELLLEGNVNIPSNLFNIAGIPNGVFPDFISKIPHAAETDNYIFVNMGDCEEKIANQLQRYDVGNEFNQFMSAQEYARCTLEWWKNWAKNTRESALIMDSAFMQCPINEMIFRKASDSEVIVYIQAIAEIIKPLNPVCVYLRRESAKIAIDFAKTVKGEHWAKSIEGLAEFGCPDLFERRFNLENTLLSFIRNIVCHIDGYDWSDAETKVQSLL